MKCTGFKGYLNADFSFTVVTCIGYYPTQAFNRTKSIVITNKHIRATVQTSINVRHINSQFNIYVHIIITESVYKKNSIKMIL